MSSNIKISKIDNVHIYNDAQPLHLNRNGQAELSDVLSTARTRGLPCRTRHRVRRQALAADVDGEDRALILRSAGGRRRIVDALCAGRQPVVRERAVVCAAERMENGLLAGRRVDGEHDAAAATRIAAVGGRSE